MASKVRTVSAWVALSLILLTVSACQPNATPVPSSVTPTATSEPTFTPSATAAPTATPKPTSEPTPTPFSFYAPTVNMSFEELVGDTGYDTLPQGYPSSDTYYVIVDICHQVVMVFEQDIEGAYTVPVRYMLCSTGRDNRTPIGTFDMLAYRVRFGKFASLGVYGQYWSQIRNRIYFHTILYEERDVSTYMEDTYTMLGQPQTPGCVYLTAPDARWIYYHIAPGTQIEIREGAVDDAETAAIRAQLVLAPLPDTRTVLETGEAPYTDNWTIEEVLIEVPFVQGSQQ